MTNDIETSSTLVLQHSLRRAIVTMLTVLLFLVYLPQISQAHEVRPVVGTLRLQDGHIELVLQLNLEAAIAGIGSDYKNTANSDAAPEYNKLRNESPSALMQELEAFLPIIRQRIEFKHSGTPVDFGLTDVNVPEVGDVALPRTTKVTFKSTHPVGAGEITWRFDRAFGDSVMRFQDSTGKVIRAVPLAGGELGGPVSMSSSSLQDMASVFVGYARLGFLHIVPKGTDHILFVLGLFLLSTRLSALTWQVSAFTIAHTVTLALGASHIIVAPPSFVEPLIAASIVYVGVENILTDKLHGWRPAIVFCFGLLHGLGFAGVLGEVGLPRNFFFTSLLGFNVGVELGQLTVLVMAFLTVGWAARKSWYRRFVAVPGSLVIACIASVWFAERTGIIPAGFIL